jgi:sporulation protein YlmC with PRC-barrel domain
MKYIANALALVLLAGAPMSALAQDQPATPAYPTARPSDQPKAGEPGRRAVRPVMLIPSEWAIGRSVYGLNDEKIGEVNDLVLARRSGRVTYVLIGQGGVLGIGEKVIAVPYSAFSWNQQKKGLTLPTSAERLKGAPALEPGDWKTLNESSKTDSTFTYFNLSRDVDPDDAAFQSAYRSALKDDDMPLLRISDLKGKQLMGDDGREIGKVEEIVYDAPSGRLAFVVVTFGGVMGIGADKVAVPWTAFDVNKDGRLFAAKLEKEAVQSAPRLKESEWAELRENGYAPRVYKHYGLSAPWLERSGGPSSQAGNPGSSVATAEYKKLFVDGSDRQLSGTVLSVEEAAPREGMSPMTCVTIRTDGGDTATVHLAPRSYLDESRARLEAGDKITVRGRWVQDGAKTYLIATELTPKSGQSVRLRNTDGSSPWTPR